MSSAYKRGKRDGIKWAITWLHDRAKTMNDPNAKAVLNTAGFHLGVEMKGAEVIFIDPIHADEEERL